MPFLFMKLPRELRDEIYGYALVSTSSIIYLKLDWSRTLPTVRGFISGGNRPPMRLFSVCRDICDEARIIFYGNNLFSFNGDDTSQTALEFFRGRPDRSLAHIRKMSLSVDQGSMEWPTGPNISSGGDRWHEVCKILAEKCSLQYLDLSVDYGWGVFTYPTYEDGVPVPISVDVTASWATTLFKIPGLHRLQVNITAGAYNTEFEYTKKHNIFSLVQMRNTMLEKRSMLPLFSGHGIRVRMAEGRGYRNVEIDMDIDQHGYSSLRPQFRVNVRPDVWCSRCGQFGGLPVNSCRCNPLSYRCYPVRDYKACDNKLWGDRPLAEYLPKHVTLDDYKQAVEHLEAGHDISIHSISKDWPLKLGQNRV